MTHLSMEVLLSLREGVSEPGLASAREHMADCSRCQSESERLHQRVAQLKALPALRPTRDHWPTVAERVRSERWRRRSWQGAAAVGLAMAASLVLTVVTRRPDAPAPAAPAVAQAAQIHEAQERSRELEQALHVYNPESRVLDGRTAGIAQALEDRIAEVDRQIEMAERAVERGQEREVLQLWHERVGLLDALVNVHVNRASHVEF